MSLKRDKNLIKMLLNGEIKARDKEKLKVYKAYVKKYLKKTLKPGKSFKDKYFSGCFL